MRRFFVSSFLVTVIAVAVWWWSEGSDTDPRAVRSTTPGPTATIESPDRPPQECAGHDARTIDFNGDEAVDWVYLDWVKDGVSGHAEFGWCIQDRHGSFATRGMSEVLRVFDLYGDGRHEAFFGGTTASSEIVMLASYSKGRVKVVELPNGNPLELVSGLYSGADETERYAVYGCDLTAGGALAQVVAKPERGVLSMRRSKYELSGADAALIDRDTETIPDPGRRFRGRDVSETVAACIEIYQSD